MAEAGFWNAEDIRRNAPSWSLEGDSKLLQFMESISQELESRVNKTKTNMNKMMLDVNYAKVALDNVTNKLAALQDSQFVENRVYDDDETIINEEEIPVDNKPDDENYNPSEMLDNILKIGIESMKKFCEKVTLDLEDSDDEGSTNNIIYRPIDPYRDRPLPYLIGSKEWRESWHIGLHDSDEDVSEEENGENDYSSDSSSVPSLSASIPSIAPTMSESECSVWGLHQNISSKNASNFRVSSDEEASANTFTSKTSSEDRYRNLGINPNIVHNNNNGQHNLLLPNDTSERYYIHKPKEKKLFDNIKDHSSEDEKYDIRKPFKVVNPPINKISNILQDEPPEIDEVDRKDREPGNLFFDSDEERKINNYNSASRNEENLHNSSKNIRKKPVNLFDDDDFDSFMKELESKNVQKKVNEQKRVRNLFDDDSDEEIKPNNTNKEVINENSESTPTSNNVNQTSEKASNLFDLDADNDNITAFSKKRITDNIKAQTKLFDDNQSEFDNTIKDVPVPAKRTIVPTKTIISNLFDDNPPDDDFDNLFKPSINEKKDLEYNKKTETEQTPTNLFKKNDYDDRDVVNNNEHEFAKTNIPATQTKNLFDNLDEEDNFIYSIGEKSKTFPSSTDDSKQLFSADNQEKSKIRTKSKENLFDESDDEHKFKSIPGNSLPKEAHNKIIENEDNNARETSLPNQQRNKIESPFKKNLFDDFENEDDFVEYNSDNAAQEKSISQASNSEDRENVTDVLIESQQTEVKSQTIDLFNKLDKENNFGEEGLPAMQNEILETRAFGHNLEGAGHIFDINKPEKSKPDAILKNTDFVSNIDPVPTDQVHTNVTTSVAKPISNIKFGSLKKPTLEDLFSDNDNDKDGELGQISEGKLFSHSGNLILNQDVVEDFTAVSSETENNNKEDADENNIVSKDVDALKAAHTNVHLIDKESNKSDIKLVGSNLFSPSLFDDMPPEDDENKENVIEKNEHENSVNGSPDISGMKRSTNEYERTSALSYNSLSLFQDIPPDDDFLGTDVKRLQSVFYDDISETITSKNDLNTLSPSNYVFSDEPPPDGVAFDGIKSARGKVIERQSERIETIEKPSELKSESVNVRQPGKLNTNLTINIAALLPGAKRPSFKTTNDENLPNFSIVKTPSSEFEEDQIIDIAPTNQSIRQTENAQASSDSNILFNVNKTRAKIPIKRRPSTRQGRKESYIRSLLLDDEAEDSEKLESISEPIKDDSKENNNKLNDAIHDIKGEKEKNNLNYISPKINLDSNGNDKSTENREIIENSVLDTSQMKSNLVYPTGIFNDSDDEDDWLVKATTNTSNNEKINENRIVKQPELPKKNIDNMESMAKKDISNASMKPSVKKEERKMSLFDDSSDDDDLFKSTTKSNKVVSVIQDVTNHQNSKHKGKVQQSRSLFGSDNEDDDLFASENQSIKTKQSDQRKLHSEVKTTSGGSLFGSMDDNDDDDDLFGGVTNPTKIKTVTKKVERKSIVPERSIGDNPLADLLKD